MKITLKFLQRDTRGRLRTTEISGDVVGTTDLTVFRRLLEAERAINDHTSLRCHIDVRDNEKSDGPQGQS